MCVMAAYVGNEPAAPVLLRILATMEGYGGGHFSGIATLHEGKIHVAKVCGDSAALLAETDALNLPGTVGIVHSRTPGFPDNDFAHPFFSCDDSVAYVANGIRGMFPDIKDDIHRRLTAEGFTFRTEKLSPEDTKTCRLYNGNIMHISDLTCGLIAEKHTRQNLSLQAAMHAAFTDYPGEISGLAISVREPAQVSACRINQPLVWARNSHGAFLATTALGLLNEHPEAIAPVPAGVSLTLRQDALNMTPLSGILNQHITPPWSLAIPMLNDFMADGKPHHIGDLAHAIRSLWPEGQLADHVMLAYQAAYDMVQANRWRVIRTTAPASRPDANAPRWLFQLATNS